MTSSQVTAINRHVPTSVGMLAIADEGSGTPVLFWPSLFADHRFFTPVRDLLVDGWRTIRIDGPGFGRSDPPRRDVQPEEYADALIEVLDEFGVERSFVAGCSWGGQIAAHMGVRWPERVSGVLMMNTPLSPSLGGHRAEVFGTRILGATRFWGRGVARSMLAPKTRTEHPERVTSFVDMFTDYDSGAAAITVATTLTRFPGLHDVLPQLTVPTTILMGEHDTLYPVSSAMPVARLASRARIDVISDCGHLAPIEAPQTVVEALRNLRELDGRA